MKTGNILFQVDELCHLEIENAHDNSVVNIKITRSDICGHANICLLEPEDVILVSYMGATTAHLLKDSVIVITTRDRPIYEYTVLLEFIHHDTPFDPLAILAAYQIWEKSLQNTDKTHRIILALKQNQHLVRYIQSLFFGKDLIFALDLEHAISNLPSEVQQKAKAILAHVHAQLPPRLQDAPEDKP